MHTLESVWGEDASEWIPERWLAPNQLPPSNTLPQGWGNLNVFADGPRNCIGYRLALFEMKVRRNRALTQVKTELLLEQVILSTLVRHFNFEDTGATIRQMVAPTLQPSVEGVKMSGGNLPLRISLVQA
jgi:cytochrome P450